QWFQCRKLCKLIDAEDKNAWLVALHVESSIESQVSLALPDATLKLLDEANIWYAAYAGALFRQKTDPQKAANLLAKAMEKDPKVIEPQERARKAVVILRDALNSLDREGKHQKEFKNGADATKAMTWLKPIV